MIQKCLAIDAMTSSPYFILKLALPSQRVYAATRVEKTKGLLTTS